MENCQSDRRLAATRIVQKCQAELVVLEACSISGWVHDACIGLGVRELVCNPNQEAWRWKNLKRKQIATTR